jgi:tripartite-type tricarboxylate transporter receptor subunit TctC
MKHLFPSALGLAVALCSCLATAQDFPVRPVRLVTIFAPGSASDVHARFLSAKMGPLLGQLVIVDNKPGGGGLVATRDVLRTQPFGYSFLYSTPEVVGNAFAYKEPGYKMEDLTVMGPFGLGSYGLIINNQNIPAKNVAEFVAYAKANPGKLNYGSLGPTAANTILAERLKQAAGIDMVGIPFKGGDPLSVALLAGDVHVYFATFYTAMQRMRNKQITGLAATSLERMKAMPDLPTLKELGYQDMVMTYWSATFLPAPTPAPIVQKLRDTLRQVTANQETKDLLAKQAIDTWSGTVEQFAAFIKKEGTDLQADYKRLNIPLMD